MVSTRYMASTAVILLLFLATTVQSKKHVEEDPIDEELDPSHQPKDNEVPKPNHQRRVIGEGGEDEEDDQWSNLEEGAGFLNNLIKSHQGLGDIGGEEMLQKVMEMIQNGDGGLEGLFSQFGAMMGNGDADADGDKLSNDGEA